VTDPGARTGRRRRGGGTCPIAGCLSRYVDRRRVRMPILLWLLGVPLTIVLLLMLFGVVHF
jgi:hypothetical protein